MSGNYIKKNPNLRAGITYVNIGVDSKRVAAGLGYGNMTAGIALALRTVKRAIGDDKELLRLIKKGVLLSRDSRKLTCSKCKRQLPAKYFDDSVKYLYEFIDCLTITGDTKDRLFFVDIHRAYGDWCKELDITPVNRKRLQHFLGFHGLEVVTMGKNKRGIYRVQMDLDNLL
jgi:hypothetical protein